MFNRFQPLIRKYFLTELLLLLLALLAARSAAIRINRDILNFYTWLFSSILVASTILLILALLFRLFRTRKRRRQNILTSVITTFVLLFLIEVLLRWTGISDTYGEKNGNYNYFSETNFENRDTWYWIHEPNETIHKQKTEFTFARTTNSLGLCEKEIPFAKDSSEFRILALGDSFTEGDGVGYDSTWLKTVERNLQAIYPHRKIVTINAGYGGSDVVYQYVLLRDKLQPYQPDMVVVSINNSDITDISIRGGMERFQPDGSVKVMEPHSWEWLYGMSHTIRLGVHAAGYSRRLDLDKQHPAEESPITAMKSIRKIQKICQENEYKLLTITHPAKEDLEQRSFNQPPMETLADSLRLSGIPYLELLEKFDRRLEGNPAQIEDIFWPLNAHFKASGYRIYGDFVTEEIVRLGWIKESK